MAEQSAAQRVMALREAATRATKLRAVAEASVISAKQQLAQIDAELTQMGINPENCDQELAALELKLGQITADLSAKVAEEITVLTAIVEAAKAAGLQ